MPTLTSTRPMSMAGDGRRPWARLACAIGAGAGALTAGGLALGKAVVFGGLSTVAATGFAPPGLWRHDAVPAATDALALGALAVLLWAIATRTGEDNPPRLPVVELLSTHVWDPIIERAEARA